MAVHDHETRPHCPQLTSPLPPPTLMLTRRPPRVREVVFRGGPGAQDHPDLFRLVEKHERKQRDVDGPSEQGDRGGNANANKKRTGGDAGSVAMAAATEGTYSERGGVGTTSERRNQRLSGADVDVAESAAFGPPLDRKKADEEAPPYSVRGQERKECVVVVEEGQKTTEPTGSSEKCPW